MYALKSSDNEIFEVEQKVIEQSETIKKMIEDGAATGEIPLQVSSKTLAKVLEWCKQRQHKTVENENDDNKGKRKKERDEDDDIKEWENKFSDELKADKDVLFDLLLASNYLDLPALLSFLCQLVADMVAGKMPEEIRRMFNIENDFTPEEEKAITAEHGWAFQP